MNSILSELIASATEALRMHPVFRRRLIWVCAPLFLAALTFYCGRSFWIPSVAQIADDVMPPVLVVVGFTLLLALTSFTRLKFADRELSLELDTLRDARTEIQARIAHSREIETKAEETVLDTIQLSLNQITEYYTINKSQAVSSFRFSVFAMVAGLATIITGIWLGFFREIPDRQLGLVTSASGILVQFISGAYFWMHQKSLSQLNYFYDKLVKMQDTMLAVQLSETLPEAEQHEITKSLIARLMDRSSVVIEPPKVSTPKRRSA